MVLSSNDLIHCEIEGPGTLLGLESGSNSDMSDWTDASHWVYQGSLIAYIKSTGESGCLTVRFLYDGLEPIELVLPFE